MYVAVLMYSSYVHTYVCMCLLCSIQMLSWTSAGYQRKHNHSSSQNFVHEALEGLGGVFLGRRASS